jgi:hypothetical protein
MEIVMENAYWNRTGTHQNLVVKLNKLIPATGEIKGSKNYQLERFRKASNAYYDIFNNGGCNRSGSIRGFFGFGMSSMSEVHRDAYGNTRRYNWNAIHEKVEPIMDKIILAAAAEQNIV